MNSILEKLNFKEYSFHFRFFFLAFILYKPIKNLKFFTYTISRSICTFASSTLMKHKNCPKHCNFKY